MSIKVSFHNLQACVQDGCPCECFHIYAFATIYEYSPGLRAIWTNKTDYFTVKETNIKSIENEKTINF